VYCPRQAAGILDVFLSVILALFFSLAFSNLSSNGVFASIPIAVADNAEFQATRRLRRRCKAYPATAPKTKLFDAAVLPRTRRRTPAKRRNQGIHPV
jgi:hypothetical protein